MRLAFVVLAVVVPLIKAITRVTVAIALFGAIIIAGTGLAQAKGGPECPGGILGPGNGTTDLVISHECHVGGGTYKYKHVNIVSDGKLNVGSLIFDEADMSVNLRIDFYATSILVENGGTLTAGTPAQPFGRNGGVLTIHLYGSNQGTSGVGIICKSPVGDAQDPVQCGIPDNIWKTNGNGESKVPLPVPDGTPVYMDYFYRYGPLPFDDGKDNLGHQGFFGYKVLAVSFGGTLQLFGKKGAVYAPEPGAQDSGKSWGRLDGTIFPTDAVKSLKVASPSDTSRMVDWEVGDHIVVTTTDYLPNHSEELIICSIAGNTIGYTADLTATPIPGKPETCPVKGVNFTHNGDPFSLSRVVSETRLKITKPAAETRAAVGLLTRSIRIVSEGKALGQPLPAAPCPSNPPGSSDCSDYYFGGHTIARQGFKLFQVQGVEFRQMGQGGRLGHYPVHFHMARQAPPNTFVKDSSINESMTRWITVHGTQGVELARNVGYLSIGHGFYLEDAVETENQLYSNLGIFARAAVLNDQNPRQVPGILASPDAIMFRPPPDTTEHVRFESDRETPAVFWITNGWNDFQGNMAAGAGMCGICFWQVPASISGPSRSQKWESYAAEQRCPLLPPPAPPPTPAPIYKPPFAQVCDRTGTSPLLRFEDNYCTSAMTSFSDVGFLQACPGVVPPPQPDVSHVAWVNNPNAPKSLAQRPECGPGGSNKNWPICPEDYYPKIDDGQVKQATQCPPGQCDDAAAIKVITCQETNEDNCLPTVINNYTTSFNWAQYNFSAVWLRTRWHLVSNSFISDVQNAGLSFISGGDYTHSSAIKGLWELALKTVFVGSTQAGINGLTDEAHKFASVLTPFYTGTNGAGLKCDNDPNTGNYCLSKNNSVTLGGFAGFAVSQHMFNIYDGPAFEDSNAFLDLKKIPLNPVSNSVYKNVLGIPKVVKPMPGGCYIANAAIAWKQPNGFYYPPTFHSKNLFFNNVDIRHYVIVPQFVGNTYTTSPTEAMTRYCTQNNGLFNGFSAIDRQTELTDDDGSLTGYANTISVNEDPFFRAPIDGIECQSDDSTTETGTARTSPYDYVTTVVYPDCKKQGGGSPVCASFDPPAPQPPWWDAPCANEFCYGVPLYREYQTKVERSPVVKDPEFIRMAGSAIFQRESMTVNHGHYYVDLTASPETQTAFSTPAFRNVFRENQTYDFFLVYAKTASEQTYQMFVGKGLDPGVVANSVKQIRVDVTNAPFKIRDTTAKEPSAISPPNYEPSTGILTVNINLKNYTNEFAAAVKNLCVPKTYCHTDSITGKCVGNDTVLPSNVTKAERDITCSYAGEDVDCPADLTNPANPPGHPIGCVGFSVTLPGGFMALDQTTKSVPPIPKQLATCFPLDVNWSVILKPAPVGLAGKECVNALIKEDFCK
jgi:hypothetical protein